MSKETIQTTGGDTFEIQIAPPVTLSGIPSDLRIHTRPRNNAPLWKYALKLTATALVSSGFHMVMLYRIGAFFHKLHLHPLCLLIEKFNFHWYHSVIPCSVQIGPALWVPHPLGIVLNSRARLGRCILLRQNVEILQIWKADLGRTGVVGDRAELNSGAVLIRGALVGEDSIVAARAVITKPIPSGQVAIGSPAKLRPARPEEVQKLRDRDPELGPGATD